MATATITKQSVIQLTPNDYKVTIHVLIVDGEETLLEKDYSERYYNQLTVGDIRVKLQAQIAADWDIYVAEQAIFNVAAFTTMVAQIQTAANTYINS